MVVAVVVVTVVVVVYVVVVTVIVVIVVATVVIVAVVVDAVVVFFCNSLSSEVYLNGCGSKRVHSRRSEKEKMESSLKGGLTGPERKREGLIVSVVKAIF